MKVLKYSLFISFISVILVFNCFGQESSSQSITEETELSNLSLEELLNIPISVSSTSAQDIFNTPSSVSVIDKNMIAEYHFVSVAEAVNHIAGMQVYRTYLKRNIPTARGILQDHYANKVLVLINGVPSWNAVTGEASLDKINIHDVERIEVLKGPASVLYGTNAYSGAINIVLKTPGEESFESYFGAGSHGIFEAGANYSAAWDNFKVFISGNSSTETGQDYIFTDEKNVSGYYQEYLKGSNFNLAASYEGHSLLFNTFVANESYLGVDPAWSSGVGNDHWSNGVLAAYEFNHSFSDAFGIKYRLSYDWNQRNLSRTFDDNTRANLQGYRISNLINFSYKVTEDLNFEAGADHGYRKSIEYMNYNVQKDSILAVNDMENKTVTEYSIFAQVGYSFSPVNLLVGTRYSNNEFFGENISSRATVVYSLNEKNSIKIIWGQSYRAPSLFELYFRTPTNTVFGNTDLQPETSSSVELSYLTSFNNFFIQALVYHSTYENKIFRVKRLPDDPSDKSTIYTNGSSFKADGLELEVKYKAEAADIFISYTYLKGDNGDEQNNDGHYNFNYIPQHVLSSGIAKNIGSFSASALVSYISEANGRIDKISGSVTADLNLSYEQKAGSFNLTHVITARNIFDETVMFPEYVRGNLNEIPSGFGRRIVYELRLSL